MADSDWTSSEKKIAPRVFDAALQRELAETMAEFKLQLARADTPDRMWVVEEWLRDKRRHIGSRYDYRYSQLDIVFGRLMREGRVAVADLAGLSAARLARIGLIASL